jgi:hypothetical protein
MRKGRVAVHAVLSCLALQGASRLLAQDDGIHWHSSYKAAIEEAKRTQKPIFLEYRCEP